MANAVLSSAFSIAVAAGVDKLVPPVQSTQSDANTQSANNLQNLAMAIFNDASLSDKAKREKVCLEVQNSFPDKTSAAYTTFVQACLAAGTATGGEVEKLSSIMTSVTSASTSLVSQTSQASTPTNKQKAADEAFKSLSSKMEDIVKQQALKPTITVDQGTPVKIFIKKDYLFPKDAVLRARVLR
jgi:type IV secretion system protein VirB10